MPVELLATKLARSVRRHSLLNESDASDIGNILTEHEADVTTLDAQVAALEAFGIVVWNEVPSGTLNGINILFVLTQPPLHQDKVQLYRNGLLMKPGDDFTLMGTMIWFDVNQIPQSGDNSTDVSTR